MFQLLRFYAAFSLLAIVATAGLLTWFYRSIAVDGMVKLARRDGLEAAQVALGSMEPALAEWVAGRAVRSGASELPPQVEAHIRGLLSDSDVLRVTLYDDRGRVVFSSEEFRLSTGRQEDSTLRAVLGGDSSSRLLRQGTGNPQEQGGVEPANVMQTRLPVRAGPGGPVRGVFELRLDVDPLVQQAEHAAVTVFWGAVSIMGVLYGALLAIVRHASRRIQRQQRAMRTRSTTLTALAGEMLRAEDARRREVAFELHEGVAQTLAAAKLQAEVGQSDAGTARASTAAMIPLLHEAIEEVRAIATDLRPASLDDLGLLPTLQALLRRLERQRPDIQVTTRISLSEHEVCPSLKSVIYRIASGTVDAVAQAAGAGRLRLCLRLEDGDLIVLRLGGCCAQAAGPMEQLTLLSGGAFTADADEHGETVLRAAWSLHAGRPGELLDLPA